MQKLFFTAVLLLSVSPIFSQFVEVLNQSTKKFKIPGNDFAYLESKSDTSEYDFVATIKVTDNKKSNIESLYNSALKKAKCIGANCFKFKSFAQSDTSNKVVLILDTYFGGDSLLDANFSLHAKNTVYIFCNDKINDSEFFNFKVNGEKQKIKSGTYFKAEIFESQEIELAKGGFLGMTMWLKWKKNRHADFFSLTGFGIGGGWAGAGGSMGVSFNTGRFNPIDGNFGSLLTQILKEYR